MTGAYYPMNRPAVWLVAWTLLVAAVVPTAATFTRFTNLILAKDTSWEPRIQQQLEQQRRAYEQRKKKQQQQQQQHDGSHRTLSVLSDDDVRRTAHRVETGWNVTVPHQGIPTPDQTWFGGISGIVYDDDRRVYYAVSNDDQDHHGPPTPAPSTLPPGLVIDYFPGQFPTRPPQPMPQYPRVYTLDVTDGRIVVTNSTRLRDRNNVPYQAGDVVPQAIAYAHDRLYIAFDRPKMKLAEFDLHGTELRSFVLPSFYNDHHKNIGFIALSISTPHQDRLYAATGDALSNDNPGQVRITEFDLTTYAATSSYVYPLRNNDQVLVALVSIDDQGSFLLLERSRHEQLPPPLVIRNNDGTPSQHGYYYYYKADLFYAQCLDALDVLSVDRLQGKRVTTMRKTLLESYDRVAKWEAMGLTSSQDRRDLWSSSKKKRSSSSSSRDLELVVMSDNEFQAPTQVILFQVEYEEIPVIDAKEETAEVIDDSNGRLATAIAIWVNPDDPQDSLLFGALFEGGIGIYDLTGTLLKRVSGHASGVDVLYAFRRYDGTLVDVLLVTDDADEEIHLYQIDYHDEDYLVDITSGTIRTAGSAYAVAGYISPFTGKAYAFVSRFDDDEILQIELLATDDNQIGGLDSSEAVRTMNVPGDAPAGGMVVDQELGFLYVAVEYGKGIVKFDAEPDERDPNDEYPKTIVGSEEQALAGGYLTGLTLYYGEHGKGYLLVSVSHDSTFAVFGRENDDFYGSFTVGNNRDSRIDRTDNTQGIAVVNVNLGGEFSCGMFVAQDEDNSPARVAGDSNLYNANTNFKMVAFDDVADHLYYELDVDTRSWSPRRFGLVREVDCIAQDIYSALNSHLISGRDAQQLLKELNDAVYYLYKPASAKHQMISLYNSDLSYYRKAGKRRVLRKAPRKYSSCKYSHSDAQKALDYVEDFLDLLAHLKEDDRLEDVDQSRVAKWQDVIGSVQDNFPADERRRRLQVD